MQGMARFNVIQEEINIVVAALRSGFMGFSSLAAAALADHDHKAHAAHTNTATVCKNLSDDIEARGVENFEIRLSEFRLTVAMLRQLSKSSEETARGLKASLQFEQARMTEKFAAGCDAVADKWEREAPREWATLLHH